MRGDSVAPIEATKPFRPVEQKPGHGAPVPTGPTAGGTASTTYTDLDGAIASARDFVGAFLLAKAADGVAIGPSTVGDARLVISELVTNVVRHASGPCQVDLKLAGEALCIAVSDTHQVAPVAHAPDPRRVGQHGLEIVLALCEGVEIEPLPLGKRVRARLALR
ncbi:ATP-binding protein [Streptomyces sp. CB03234]|uniref:ATP-binding protein n=1 Tax=Streptomyces sp. (strain CB03234) TaxID=1703937 RepID=UPI0009A2555E|nr:ATP-binding protein [Streptomyces sp. CB03234]